ncbi:MAG TPA: hypothetical protein VNX88_07390 [Terriglobales bacterium]|jgi:hypothetical protein|nr:hypothetical protein [Terriglobales bacterium]
MRQNSENTVRLLVVAVAFALILSGALPLISKVLAAGETVQVRLDASQIQPRPLEQLTGQSITKTYSNAWKNMETALAENRPDLIDESFVGYAHDKLVSQVQEQKKIGLATRYVDHGHQVSATFYSPEGSAVQLQDTAQLEIQLLDGGKVVSSQNVTRKYIAVVTVVEDSWKVRILDGVPAF